MIRSYAELKIAMSRLSSTKYAWLGLASELRQGNPNPNLTTLALTLALALTVARKDQKRTSALTIVDALYRPNGMIISSDGWPESHLGWVWVRVRVRVGVGARAGVWVAVRVGFGLVSGLQQHRGQYACVRVVEAEARELGGGDARVDERVEACLRRCVRADV